MNTAALVVEGTLWMLRCCVSTAEACEQWRSRRDANTDSSAQESHSTTNQDSESISGEGNDTVNETETLSQWALGKMVESNSFNQFGNFINQSFAMFHAKCAELDRKFGFESVDCPTTLRRRCYSC